MKVEFRDTRIAPGDDLQPLIERCIGFAFAGHRDQVDLLHIYIADVNEPRDGKDKRCRVKARLSTGQQVVTEIMDSDLDVAIHRALDRAGWTTARWLQRERLRASRFERPIVKYPNQAA